MTYTTLISSEALADRLDEAIVVVDCRVDLKNEAWGWEQYLDSHVPGAVYAGLAADLSGEKTGANGRHPLPSVAEMTATFGRWGIAPATQVVAYDQDSGAFASRLWWMLRYLGHDAVAVLDGGWEKWQREGRPVRAGQESREPAVFVPAPRPGMLITADEVMSAMADASRLLIDARSPERYEGRAEPLDRAAGHIPGAANHFYKWNLTDERTLLAPDDLRVRLAARLGGHTPEQTVMYCGSGVTACHNLLAMEHAGLPGARLYVGSWSEWSSDETRPVERATT